VICFVLPASADGCESRSAPRSLVLRGDAGQAPPDRDAAHHGAASDTASPRCCCGHGLHDGPRRGTKPMEGTSVGRRQRRPDDNGLCRRSKASKPIRSAMVRRTRIPSASAVAMLPLGTTRGLGRGSPRRRLRAPPSGRADCSGWTHPGPGPISRPTSALPAFAQVGTAPVAEVLRGCPRVASAACGTSRSVTWGSASADRSFTESDRRPASAGR
jgi:hypothetical protein